MECLNIDLIGPFPEGGFILTIICCFTRFIELYKVLNSGAVESAKALLHFVGRYGAPTQIRSDKGPTFVNHVIEEFLRLIGTEHLLTLAYSKEENAMVERANKETMRHVRAIFDSQIMADDYEMSLPLVQRIMNASIHEAIGVSPSQLLFGTSINLDRGIFLPQKDLHDREGERMNLSEWAEKMLEKQAVVLNIARQRQDERNKIHLAEAAISDGKEYTEYPINSYVLVEYHDRPPSKLHTRLKGPMRVVEKKDASYTLQDLVTNRIQKIHISKLRPFNFDNNTDPRVVANKDQRAYDIDHIYAHQPKKFTKTNLQFRVRWAGYTEQDDTWEPWKSMRLTEACHKYLREHGMSNLIPKQFRIETDMLGN
jgi:hypothetical protein